MPCPKLLRTQLNPTAQPGGIWTYIGYSSNSPTGPFTATPQTSLVQVPPGGVLSGDNPLVNPASASPGFYRFSYFIDRPPCAPSLKLITMQVAPRANSGNDFSTTLCTNASTVSLQTLFNQNSGVTTIANETVITGNASIGPAPTYNFNPAAAGAGVYTFTRTVTRTPSSGFTLDCEDCIDTSTATITVLDNSNAGVPTSSPQLTVCSFDTPINLANLLTGEATNGDWYFVGPATGNPSYTTVNMTVNSNLFNNATNNFAVGTQLSNDSNQVTVNLQNAARGRIYRFRYVINAGTPCEAFSEVQIHPQTQPLTGSGTNETICYQNIPTPSAFPIYSWLTGATGSGTWSISSNPARPNKINQSWNVGSNDPLNPLRGTDDTFNFANFRATAANDIPGSLLRVPPGTPFAFTFTYNNPLYPGQTSGCTSPPASTFTKTIVFTYNPGTTNNGIDNPFPVPCTGSQVFNPRNLVLYSETGGYWHVAPTQLAPTSIPVPNLIVNGGPQQTFAPGDLIVALSDANFDWTNVPNGTYALMYKAGGGWAAPDNVCPRNTIVYIRKDCCIITAGITNNTGSTELTCSRTSINVTATGGVSYAWSHGPTTASVSLVNPGTYTVTVTNAQGCTAQASITITQNANPPNVIITPNPATSTLECNVSSITLTASGANTYSWANGLGTNPVITVNTAGTYTVTGTGSNGCTDVESFIVTGSSPCPCNGQRGVFILRNDFGADINAGTAQITSFVVNGAQLITTPVNFNRIQNISQSYGNCKGCPPPSNLGTLHNAAATNALDALAIPCFDFEVPTIAEIQGTASNIPDGYSLCNPKYTKIRAPMCVDWSITVSTGANPYSGVSAASVVTWANVNGVVSVTGSASSLLGVNTFPNYSCLYFGGNNVIPLGTESIC